MTQAGARVTDAVDDFVSAITSGEGAVAPEGSVGGAGELAGATGEGAIGEGSEPSNPGELTTSRQKQAGQKDGTPLPSLDRTGKVHGDIPAHLPDDWSLQDLEELAHDLPVSIQTRQREQLRLGEEGNHRERLRQERQLLRQVSKRLSGS